MTEYVLLAAMAILILIMLTLRTNTAVCFLALCAGSVLLASSGDNMSLMASSLTSGLDTSTNIMRIILLFAPLAVVMVALRKHLKKSQVVLAFVPAVATALLAAIFVLPELSEATQASIVATESWKVMMQYQEFIVAFGLVASIILVVLTVKKPEDKHKKGRHR